MSLNALARRIVDEILARGAELGITTRISESGAVLIDCGTSVPGSDEAGIALARATLGGLGDVRLDPPRGLPAEIPGASPWLVPSVVVTTDAPVASRA